MRKILLLAVLAAAAVLLADSGGGVAWTPPAGWKAEAARPMRAATYSIPAAPGDPAGAECGVYYFGPGQGGSVQANLDRWIGQFAQPGGKPSKDAARIERQTVHGLKTTTVDVSGAYAGMSGPAMQPGAPQPGYRLLGAIIETPTGSVFFKFTGPAKTIAANQRAFEKMIQSAAPKP